MELKDYKEITIDGTVMKSIAVNGETIWTGNPDDLYLIKAGVSQTGNWSVSGSYTNIYWNVGGRLQIRTETGPRSNRSWVVTCGVQVDVTEFTKLHVVISESQSNRSGWNTYFRANIGSQQLNLGAGIETRTERILDISELTGNMTFSLSGANYGDSASYQTIHDTMINDVWLSAE